MSSADRSKLTRRRMIGTITSSAAFLLGENFAQQPTDAQERVQADATKTATIIDSHIHLVDPKLPGVPLGATPNGISLDDTLERVAKTVREEMEQSDTVAAFCMPQYGKLPPDDILGVNRTLALRELVPNLHAIGIADPQRIAPDDRKQIEKLLAEKQVKALKCYLGYVHAMPSDLGYAWYFQMAQKYSIPIIFHTGDTYSRKAKLKYAHPLGVDEVVVDYPEVNFVLAHLGNPWITDAAEIIYKNNQLGAGGNVWTDLSGLLVGPQFATYSQSGVLDELKKKVRHAIGYSERPDRFLYGSDWPLSKMEVYRDFIREAVPEEHHQAIFSDNAKDLFKL